MTGRSGDRILPQRNQGASPARDRLCIPRLADSHIDGRKYARRKLKHLRVLVHESRGVVDLIVDDQVEILLVRVLRDLGESKFLRHDAVSVEGLSTDWAVLLSEFFAGFVELYVCWRLGDMGKKTNYTQKARQEKVSWWYWKKEGLWNSGYCTVYRKLYS